MTASSFADLGLPKPLIRALDRRDITEPFPVQAATIPDALAGRDVCGKAPTGSGKTLAFGLPTLATVGTGTRQRPRALMLAPTRELAEQIKQELRPLAKAADRRVFAVYGGVGYGPQRAAMRKGIDVLVATPGRLEDLMEQGTVDLRDIEVVVIDEADRMADMGFLPAVRRILDQTPRERQTLLFSATLDGDIDVLRRKYQRDPVMHEAASMEEDTGDAAHHVWLVDHHDRVEHTADVIDAMGSTIVFTRTRHGADRLAKQLGRHGVTAVAMHGGRSQNQRNRALRTFTSGSAQALVATDVAARGIHVDAVAGVVHFDPPNDAKDYVHRSGRTARAGATGVVVSLVTGAQRRAVGRMLKDLDLPAPFESPDVDALAEGGTRIGDLDARSARHEGPRDRSDNRRNGKRNGNGDGHDRARGNGHGPKDRRPASTPSIYVANLPWSMEDDDVARLFARFGKVEQATVIMDRRTGRSKGFAFVDMPEAAAKEAISALHGSDLQGRDLTVRFAKPRRWVG